MYLGSIVKIVRALGRDEEWETWGKRKEPRAAHLEMRVVDAIDRMRAPYLGFGGAWDRYLSACYAAMSSRRV